MGCVADTARWIFYRPHHGVRSTPFWHAEHAKGVDMFVLCAKILKRNKENALPYDENISAIEFGCTGSANLGNHHLTF